MGDAEGVLVSGAPSEAGLGVFFQVGAVLQWGLNRQRPTQTSRSGPASTMSSLSQ